MTPAAARYIRYLESLAPKTLDVMGDYVADDVHFSDPFNDVHGVESMAGVFRHMFDNIKDIEFRIHRAAMDGNTCLMAWRFEGKLEGRKWTFNGCSTVTFSSDGLVTDHVDYWDAAQNFYRRLPVIGWVISRIKRRLAIHRRTPDLSDSKTKA